MGPWLPPPSRSRSSLPQREVLRMDRRLHPGFSLHLPADVDLQAGVRRVWPIHRPQEVLLSSWFMFLCCLLSVNKVVFHPVLLMNTDDCGNVKKDVCTTVG